MSILGFVGDTVGLPGLFGSNRRDKIRESFDPYSGMPSYPDYIGMTPQQLTSSPYLNRAPMDQFTAEAMRSGTGHGAKLAMANQNALALDAKQHGQAQAQGEAATSRAMLASKGGLSSGASERIAKSAGNRALDLNQAASQNTASQNRLISMEDENNRIKMLGQAPGMQLQASQFDLGAQEGNINRQAQEMAKRNQYNLGGYNSSMQAWAGGKQAQATQNAGKK